MRLPRPITNPLLACLSRVLHVAPLKTRLGGISTIVAGTLGLGSMSETRTATLRNGITLPVRLSDYNGRMLYLFGTPDPKIVCVCRSLLREGDVLLDIGANYGSVGLLAHGSLGSTGSLHFVEPQPELCRAIREAIERAHILNARVHNCGVWDEDDELNLRRPKNHTGAASLVPGTETDIDADDDEVSIRVPVRAIGPLLDECAADRQFGAKVDVEGAEPKILPAILGHPGMRFVLFECNTDPVRDHAWELALRDRLVFFGLSKRLFRTRIRAITNRRELDRVHDVLAVRMHPSMAPRGEVHPSELGSLLRALEEEQG